MPPVPCCVAAEPKGERPPVVLVGQFADAASTDPITSSAYTCSRKSGSGQNHENDGSRCSKKHSGKPTCYRSPSFFLNNVVPPTHILCKNRQFPTATFLVMNELRRSSNCATLCDVVVQAGEKLIPAHRIVLVSASGYFRTHFLGDNLAKSTKEPVHKLENVSEEVLEQLVEFCYTAEIVIDQHNVCEILPSAVVLQIPHITECCITFLTSQLDPSNALGMGFFANSHGCPELHRRVAEYIDKHFMQISHEEEFLQLHCYQLLRLIKRDELVVSSESEVYNAVLRWVRFEERSRRPQLENIINGVRCYFLPPSFLHNQLRSCQVLKDQPECRNFIKKIAKDLTFHKRYHMQTQKRRSPNWPQVIYVVAGSQDCRISLDRVDCFDAKAGKWLPLSPMPTARSGICCLFVNGLLYAIGGRSTVPEGGSSDMNIVERYDPFSDSWRSCPGMSVERHRAGAVMMENVIYVVGGSSRQTFHRTAERYNPSHESWTPIAAMDGPRMGLGVVVVNGLLYAVGGYDGAQRLKSVTCYDPDQNEWTAVASMQQARSGAGVVTLDGLIYVLGGYDGEKQLGSIERYDPETDEWIYLPAVLPTPRSGLSVVAVNGKLVTIGGFDGRFFSSAVEHFDVDQNTWTTDVAMPMARCGHGAGVWWGSA